MKEETKTLLREAVESAESKDLSKFWKFIQLNEPLTKDDGEFISEMLSSLINKRAFKLFYFLLKYIKKCTTIVNMNMNTNCFFDPRHCGETPEECDKKGRVTKIEYKYLIQMAIDGGKPELLKTIFDMNFNFKNNEDDIKFISSTMNNLLCGHKLYELGDIFIDGLKQKYIDIYVSIECKIIEPKELQNEIMNFFNLDESKKIINI